MKNKDFHQKKEPKKSQNTFQSRKKLNLFSINYTHGIKFLLKPIKFGSFKSNGNETNLDSINETESSKGHSPFDQKKRISNTSVEPRFIPSALLKFLEVLDGLCGLL